MPFGSAPYQYKPVPGWGSATEMGMLSGVAVSVDDRVFVVDRQPQAAIIEFDREGRKINSWGEDIFDRPHDICIGPDGRVYIPDCDDHTVRICTLEGGGAADPRNSRKARPLRATIQQTDWRRVG